MDLVQTLLLPFFILLALAVIVINFLVLSKAFKILKKESIKAEVKSKQKLPPYSWKRMAPIYFVLFAIAFILFLNYPHLSRRQIFEPLFILFSPIVIIMILKPLLIVYLGKTIYPITRDPWTRMHLIFVEQYPERAKKVYRILGIIVLVLILIYFGGQFLGLGS